MNKKNLQISVLLAHLKSKMTLKNTDFIDILRCSGFRYDIKNVRKEGQKIRKRKVKQEKEEEKIRKKGNQLLDFILN